MGSSDTTFNPKTDIPSLEGKVILITGGNKGIGKQAVLDLAEHSPSEIWIAARDLDAARAVAEEAKGLAPHVSIRLLHLDLASFASVKQAAKQFLASASRLDICILNSGIMAGPHVTTEEGYEMQFGVNHMGHALLLKLLVPLLLTTASAHPESKPRVVVTSSAGHKGFPGGIAFESLKSPAEDIEPIMKYCQSKMANVLHAKALAEHYPQFTTVSIYPGAIFTGLYLKMDAQFQDKARRLSVGVQEGVKTTLWAATAENVVSGEYYEPVGVAGKASELANDKELVKKLWEFTETELQGQQI